MSIETHEYFAKMTKKEGFYAAEAYARRRMTIKCELWAGAHSHFQGAAAFDSIYTVHKNSGLDRLLHISKFVRPTKNMSSFYVPPEKRSDSEGHTGRSTAARRPGSTDNGKKEPGRV